MPIAHHGALFRRWPGGAGVINRADWRSQPLAAQPGAGRGLARDDWTEADRPASRTWRTGWTSMRRAWR